MLQCSHDVERAHASGRDWRRFTILCGIPCLAHSLTASLQALGLLPDHEATTTLLFDLPTGFALKMLETRDLGTRDVIVMTENVCPEYAEDLWDLDPAGLLVGVDLDRALLVAMAEVADGARYRLAPTPSSSLTTLERSVLRYAAQGWEDRRIAQHLHVLQPAVVYAVRRIEAELNVADRVQAVLYYWGRADLIR